VRGQSVRAIARKFRCTVDDVHDVLDKFGKITLTARLRTHTLALELERLDDLTAVFESKAGEGDVASAHLVSKIIERRCILLGLAADRSPDH
jgi:hypothetical protein